MSYQEQSYSWLFSSNPALGAQSITKGGSTFSTYLSEGFTIPKNAFGIEIGCVSASIWWNQFNVTVDNNKFSFLRNDGALLQVDIPPGLYSFDELNRTLKNLLLFDYNITNYALAPIQSSQRVSEVFIVTPNPSIIRTYWPLGTLQNLLGFDVTRVTSNPVGTSGQYFGDRTARFNQIDFYIIQTSLLSRGIRLNNKYAGVIAQVPIDNVPGSLINYAPQNIQWTAAPELGNGSTTNNVTTILTDSNGNPVDTQGESYSVAIQVKYKVPLY